MERVRESGGLMLGRGVRLGDVWWTRSLSVHFHARVEWGTLKDVEKVGVRWGTFGEWGTLRDVW